MWCTANQSIGFFERNEGQLLGTAGGIIIAFLASFLTYYFSRRNANRRDKDAYQGLLYTMHIELFWADHHFDLLKRTLENFQIVSLQELKFLLDRIPMKFEYSVIERGLLNIISYKYYNHNIVAFLMSYLNSIRYINEFLDFKSVSVLLESTQDPIKREGIIRNYFSVLDEEYIQKSQPFISLIRQEIEKELADYPKEKMVFVDKLLRQLKKDRQ